MPSKIAKKIKKDTKREVGKLLKPKVNFKLARSPRMISNGNTKETPAFKLACSIANPWDCSTCIPDGARGVGCFTLKQQQSLQTGTGSAYGIVLNPDPRSFNSTDSGNTSASSTYTAWASSTQIVGVTNLYKSFRPVSAGLRVTYTGSTINDQGVLFLGQCPANTALADLSSQSIGQLADKCMYSTTIPLRNGGQITWRPEAMEDTAEWQEFKTAAASTDKIPRPIIIVQVYGASTGQASSVQVELVANFEGQYVAQSFLPGGESMSVPKNSIEPGWFEKAKQFLTKVRPIMSLAATTVGSALSGSSNPLLSVVGQLANGIGNPKAMAISNRM